MLDHLRIRSRIAEARKRVIRLQEIVQSTDRESFINGKNDLVLDATERNLEVTIQTCIDIASHIVAQIALEKPNENKELFSILAKHNIISKSLSVRLMLMSGLRNILVHEYLEVEEEKIYDSIKNDLEDVIEYAKNIELFLEKQKK